MFLGVNSKVDQWFNRNPIPAWKLFVLKFVKEKAKNLAKCQESLKETKQKVPKGM